MSAEGGGGGSGVNPLSFSVMSKNAAKLSKEQKQKMIEVLFDDVSNDERKDLIKHIFDKTPNCHKNEMSSILHDYAFNWRCYLKECRTCTNCNDEIWNHYDIKKCEFCSCVICEKCRDLIGILNYKSDRLSVCNDLKCTKIRRKIYKNGIIALRKNWINGYYVGNCNDCDRDLYGDCGFIRYGGYHGSTIRCLECVRARTKCNENVMQ